MINDLVGQKFNRLTVVSKGKDKIEGKIVKPTWKCLCDCGNEVEVKNNSLLTNNTKSCGCLKTEQSKLNAIKLITGRRKFTPYIASARRVWKSYCYRDPLCLEFDDFLKISQMNCFYCGINPNTKFNYFKIKSSRGSEKAKKEGLFIYNGMDRIDSSKNHTLDNVVPCCYLCNRAKSNRSQKEFYLWTNNLKRKIFSPLKINLISYPINGSMKTSIKCVFINYRNDTDLNIEEYYSISQMNCFYCEATPNNQFNRAKTDKKSSLKAKENGNYIYNGLDRIDSNLNHTKNNIVPCCKYCNWAKSGLNLIEFYEWIERIQNCQK